MKKLSARVNKENFIRSPMTTGTDPNRNTKGDYSERLGNCL